MQKDFEDLKDGVSTHDISCSSQSAFLHPSVELFTPIQTLQHWKPEFCARGAPIDTHPPLFSYKH